MAYNFQLKVSKRILMDIQYQQNFKSHLKAAEFQVKNIIPKKSY